MTGTCGNGDNLLVSEACDFRCKTLCAIIYLVTPEVNLIAFVINYEVFCICICLLGCYRDCVVFVCRDSNYICELSIIISLTVVNSYSYGVCDAVGVACAVVGEVTVEVISVEICAPRSAAAVYDCAARAVLARVTVTELAVVIITPSPYRTVLLEGYGMI